MMAPILTNAEVQQRLPPQRREFTSERRRDPEHTQLTSAPAVDEYVQQCLGLRAAWPAHESGLVCQRRLWTPPTEEGSKGDSKEKKEDDEDMSLDNLKLNFSKGFSPGYFSVTSTLNHNIERLSFTISNSSDHILGK